jgi:glycosyltransferase involved in cell wall biosynthesis
VTTLPNPAPVLPSLASREELREQLGFVGPTLAFAGRITRQKALGVALAAVKTLDGVNLVIAGDGPDLPAVRNRALELGLGERVRFVGALSRQGVLELFRASDASVISSEWENFPHTVVEALAAGTPVIATAVGGVAEIVSDGENGLLVPPGDATALAEAIGRFLADDELSARLRAAAAPSVEQLRPEIVYRKLELILISASHR